MKKIEIIYQDHQLIIANKPAGIPVQKSTNDQKSLIEILEKQLNTPVFVTHRLDQVTSGICMMTKNKRSCSAINEQLRNNKIEKNYLAVVNAGTAKAEDHLEMKLKHNEKSRKAFVHDDGAPAQLDYKKIASSDNYDLLHVRIDSGRFHQIRAMLSAVGMPIKGDVKYGARRANKDRSIHLHALSLSLVHPKTQEILSFSAPLPPENLWQYFSETLDNLNEQTS